MTGCHNLTLQEDPHLNKNRNICLSGIEVFRDLSKESLKTLPRNVKENMILVNCTLYSVCDFAIPKPENCKI